MRGLFYYVPTGSPVHRLDARAKIVATAVLIFGVFFVRDFHVYGLYFIAIAALFATSRIDPRCLRDSFKTLLWFTAFTVGVYTLFGQGLEPKVVFLKWGVFLISKEGIIFGIKMSLRICAIVLLSSLLTAVTSPTELADGTVSLLKPLRLFKVPVDEIGIMVSIALRFVPILVDEAERIMKAQMARGADFSSGNFLERAGKIASLIVPLFVSAFNRAEDLALAMEARGFVPGVKRTRLTRSKFGIAEAFAIVVSVAWVGGVILWQRSP